MITQVGWKHFIKRTVLDEDNLTYVFLVKADFDGGDNTLEYADLTEADYPGYARQIYNDGSGVPDLDSHPWGRFLSGTFTFQPSGIVTPQVIYGIGTLTVFDGDTILLSLERFDAPVTLNVDTDKVERGIDFYARSFTP